MNKRINLSKLLDWNDHTRVPYGLYSDPAIYRRELERIFYGPFWHPVALEAEISNPGDYKTVYVGETPLIVTRVADDEFKVLINACAHRGVRLTSEFLGKATDFTCPYHGWCYDTRGTLRSAPGEERFREDFRRKDFNLRELRTVLHGQVLWATFDENTAPFAELLGAANASFLTAMGGGERKLTLLGYQKVVFNCNWKIYMDNDGYHAGILHTAFRMLDFAGGQATIVAGGTGGHWGADYKITPYKDNGYLKDPSVVFTEGQNESAAVNLIRPLTQAVKHFNSINFGFGRPLGPDKVEVHYSYLGYADDPPELARHRIRQSSNLLGPSGFVSIEDGAMFERVQKAISAPGGTVNFVKGLADSPDGRFSMQNDEAANTPWWADYRERLEL